MRTKREAILSGFLIVLVGVAWGVFFGPPAPADAAVHGRHVTDPLRVNGITPPSGTLTVNGTLEGAAVTLDGNLNMDPDGDLSFEYQLSAATCQIQPDTSLVLDVGGGADELTASAGVANAPEGFTIGGGAEMVKIQKYQTASLNFGSITNTSQTLAGGVTTTTDTDDACFIGESSGSFYVAGADFEIIEGNAVVSVLHTQIGTGDPAATVIDFWCIED